MGDCGKVAVSAPYPNPVTVGRTVRFDLAAACSTQVHWKVVTAAYRKVLETTIATRGATTSVAWDLKDAKGRSVAPGLYYLVVKPEGQGQEVRSVLVLP